MSWRVRFWFFMMRARTRLVQLSSFSPLVALLYIPGSLIYEGYSLSHR